MAAELSERRFPLLPPRSDPTSQGKFSAIAAASPAASHGSTERSNRATRKPSTSPATAPRKRSWLVWTSMVSDRARPAAARRGRSRSEKKKDRIQIDAKIARLEEGHWRTCSRNGTEKSRDAAARCAVVQSLNTRRARRYIDGTESRPSNANGSRAAKVLTPRSLKEAAAT